MNLTAAIKAILENDRLVDEISKLAKHSIEGKISICFPKMESEKNKIHFIIETGKKINFFELAELTNSIIEKLGGDIYEDNEWIIVQDKKLFNKESFDKLFSDITYFSKENFEQVRSFIDNKYRDVIENDSKMKSHNSIKNSVTEAILNPYNQAESSIIDNNYSLLPSDIKSKIFGYLPLNSFITSRKVCKNWRNVIDKMDNSYPWKSYLLEYTNLNEEELAYLEMNDGGYKYALKLYKEMKKMNANENKVDDLEKLIKTNPIAGILFFASTLNTYWNFPDLLAKIASKIGEKYPLVAKSLLTREKLLIKTLIENYYDEDDKKLNENNFIILAKSHEETAKLLYNNKILRPLFKGLKSYVLAHIGKKSVAHAKLVLTIFSEKFSSEDDAQGLSEMAQVNTETAKFILQNEKFISLLTKSDVSAGNTTHLHIIASSKKETAEWIFSVPELVKKFTEKDLDTMFKTSKSDYEIDGQFIKDLYHNYLKQHQISRNFSAKLLTTKSDVYNISHNNLNKEMKMPEDFDIVENAENSDDIWDLIAENIKNETIPELFSQKNENGETLISKIVEKIFEFDDPEDGYDILHNINLKCGDYLKYEYNEPQNKHGDTLLHIAVKCYVGFQHNKLISELCDLNDEDYVEAIFEIKNKKKQTPFKLACINGIYELVRLFLLGKLLDKNYFDTDTDTDTDTDIEDISMYRLYENRFNNLMMDDSSTLKLLDLLNKKDSTGNTLLYQAILDKNDEVCLILIAAGASIKLKNKSQHNARAVAKKVKNKKIEEILDEIYEIEQFIKNALESRGNKQYSNLIELSVITASTDFFLYLRDDIDTFEDAIDDLRLEEILQDNILSLLETEGTDDIIVTLLAYTSPDFISNYIDRDNNCWSILHHCAAENWSDKIQLILNIYFSYAKRNFSIDKDDLINELDDSSCFTKEINLIQVIELRKKVKNMLTPILEVKDSQSNTPLHLALSEGHMESLMLLLAANSTIDESAIEKTNDPDFKALLYVINMLDNKKLKVEEYLLNLIQIEDNATIAEFLTIISEEDIFNMMRTDLINFRHKKGGTFLHLLDKKLQGQHNHDLLKVIVKNQNLYHLFKWLSEVKNKKNIAPIFIKSKILEYAKKYDERNIKTAVLIIAQGKRCKSSLFSRIPEGVDKIIASKVASVIDDQTALEIAKKAHNKP